MFFLLQFLDGFCKFHHFSLLSVNSRLLLVWRDSIIFLFTFLFMLQPEVTLPHKFNFSPSSSSSSSLYKPPASPSYHLSRPAHVSVVREVPGIQKFAQYSYSALLCKGILMSPSLQHCSVVGQRYSTSRHTAPLLPCTALSQLCSCPFSQFIRFWVLQCCINTRTYKWIACIIWPSRMSNHFSASNINLLRRI